DVRVDLILRLEDAIGLVTVEIPERISYTHRGCGPSGTNASAVENGRIRIEEGNLIVKSRKVCRDLVSEIAGANLIPERNFKLPTLVHHIACILRAQYITYEERCVTVGEK